MDIQAELHHKCADPDLQLDVDIMTFDYLVYAAIVAVLRDWSSQQRGHLAVTEWTDSTERALTSVDSEYFYRFFLRSLSDSSSCFHLLLPHFSLYIYTYPSEYAFPPR